MAKLFLAFEEDSKFQTNGYASETIQKVLAESGATEAEILSSLWGFYVISNIPPVSADTIYREFERIDGFKPTLHRDQYLIV
jgi:hypothetical protein